MNLPVYLLFPALAAAQLSITVDVSTRKEDVTVSFGGGDESVIEPSEISGFGLNDAALKDASSRYFGARPTKAYLRSPTPWGDLYQSYGWTQVHRVLKPIKATVLGIHSEPTIIATQKFHNNMSKVADFTADIKQQVSNTITSSWSSTHSITVKEEITYKFLIPVGEIGGNTTFSYQHKWGKGGSDSTKVTVGTKAGTTVKVQPGATALATMTASRGTLEIEVVYEASLYGQVAANYDEGYKGHYFWRFDVNAVMDAGGIPSSKFVTEVIKVGFYADANIEVTDDYRGD